MAKDEHVNEKEVIMNLRLQKGLRDTFVQSCKSQDTTASRELRAFMRRYIAKHGQQKLL